MESRCKMGQESDNLVTLGESFSEDEISTKLLVGAK